jgi:hypothetical protein
MESNKANRWLTLGANIGVLIGIILLVVELDQNREMIRAQTRSDISQQSSSRLLLVGTNLEMASLMRRANNGEELTPDERVQFNYYQFAAIRDWENVHYQYRQGTFDKQEFDALINVWRRQMNNHKAFLNAWCLTRLNYSPDFVADVEGLANQEVCAASK